MLAGGAYLHIMYCCVALRHAAFDRHAGAAPLFMRVGEIMRNDANAPHLRAPPWRCVRLHWARIKNM
jgi:hypothetical protein